jgi:signal peptidase II
VNKGAKTVLIILIAIICVGCDQVTKSLAREQLVSRPPIILLDDIVRIHYSENTGAMLGLGANLPPNLRFWLLSVLAGLMLIGMLVFAWRSDVLDFFGILGIGLLVGGGVSNLIDRIVSGRVIDFMNIGIGNLRTGIFNVADVAIMLGAGLIIVWSIRSRDSGGQADQSAHQD